MNTLLMLLMFPIGLYTYFVIEKKDKREYQAVFDNFQKNTLKKDISNIEKLELFELMLEKNGYKIKEQSENLVVGEKKILSMGLMMMGLGVYIIGLFFYLFYFYLFQKPYRVEFRI